LLKNREEDFKSLQRIIQGETEGLRDETILLRRLIAETDEKWQRESTERFIAATDRDELMKHFTELEKSLRERAEDIRGELLNSMQSNVDNIREEHTGTQQAIDNIKTDISRSKEELSSHIERRIDDKLDFVIEMLQRINLKSEQLIQVWTAAKASILTKASKSDSSEDEKTPQPEE